MKKSFIILVSISILISFAIPISVFAGDLTETIVLNKQPTEDNPNNRPGNNPDGNRMPPRPILCTISIEYGIECEIADEDILTYEIWSEDNSTCIAEFVDAAEFVSYLFSVPGSYQIRFLTDDYVYSGFITI